MLNTMNAMSTAEDNAEICILQNGSARVINYEELERFHQGNSWFGCVLGFRLLQLAARELADESGWPVDGVYIVSGHPGPGVRDAFELITGCVTAGRFRLLPDITDQDCNRNMRYEWWISDGDSTLYIKLKANIVPNTFFALLDRIGTDFEKREDRRELEHLKIRLSNRLWALLLDDAFQFSATPSALKVGELPDA